MKAWIIAAALMFLPMPALAQAQLTQADIQRLQDSVYDASADVTRSAAARCAARRRRSSASSTTCAMK